MPAIDFKRLRAFIPLILSPLMWAVQVSLESKVMPRNVASATALMIEAPGVLIAASFVFVLVRVKITSFDLASVTVMPMSFRYGIRHSVMEEVQLSVFQEVDHKPYVLRGEFGVDEYLDQNLQDNVIERSFDAQEESSEGFSVSKGLVNARGQIEGTQVARASPAEAVLRIRQQAMSLYKPLHSGFDQHFH